jgi:hypothetical protein
MKNLSLVYIILILFMSDCSPCDKDSCVEPAEPFKFRIIDRNSREDLVFSDHPRYDPDSLRLYYYEEDEKVELFLRQSDNARLFNFLINQALPYVSALNGIKDFYLQLNLEDTDTLLIDVKEIEFECCRVFQYAGSYFNGREMKRSPEDFTVYLIEK